jgi:hypothetical protein
MAGAAVRRLSGLLDPEASLSPVPAGSTAGAEFSGGYLHCDSAEPVNAGGHSTELNGALCAVGGELAVYAPLPSQKRNMVPNIELPVVISSPNGNILQHDHPIVL